MIEFNHYTVTYEIRQAFLFETWPGFYIRNALVKAFAEYCTNPSAKTGSSINNCSGCPHLPTCIYAALNFPVNRPVAAPLPMPFILNTENLVTGKYVAGTFSFGITLVGKANLYLQHFHDAFRNIGQKFGIGETGKAGNIQFVSMKEKSVSLFASINDETNKITLHFRHLKLPEKEMTAGFSLSFDKLTSMLHSRIAVLQKLYGAEIADKKNLLSVLPGEGLIKTESRFCKCNYRYAGTGKGHYFLNGQVSYMGNIFPWKPLIETGSEIGIGRFTTYGFGKYKLIS